ncbi:ParA family protein [Thiothrix subterranea]|uniref:ParA family protein n=1 Tax=Thiothrix subterranea TaxID=2735563 RepID=UPI00280B22CB|nr:ParA family protein [Thiothrix subterranea]
MRAGCRCNQTKRALNDYADWQPQGRTGKSTITFNLALWVATRHNKHVVVYDLDPQGASSRCL